MKYQDYADMSANEIIDFEFAGGEGGHGTSDLTSALADKLLEALNMLSACAQQISAYSDSTRISGAGREYSTDEIELFIR